MARKLYSLPAGEVGIGFLFKVFDTFFQRRDGLSYLADHGVLGSGLASTAAPWREVPCSLPAARRLFHDAFQYHWDTHFTGEFMPKVDGGTMHYALEARAPFLDQKLWEYAGALPFGLRLHNGQLKAVLREIARRRIGTRVSAGAKRGFGIPVGRWLAGKWGPRFEELMRDSLLHKSGYIDAPQVLAHWRRTAASGSVPNQLWYIFVLENWFRLEHSRGAR